MTTNDRDGNTVTVDLAQMMRDQRALQIALTALTQAHEAALNGAPLSLAKHERADAEIRAALTRVERGDDDRAADLARRIAAAVDRRAGAPALDAARVPDEWLRGAHAALFGETGEAPPPLWSVPVTVARALLAELVAHRTRERALAAGLGRVLQAERARYADVADAYDSEYDAGGQIRATPTLLELPPARQLAAVDPRAAWLAAERSVMLQLGEAHYRLILLPTAARPGEAACHVVACHSAAGDAQAPGADDEGVAVLEAAGLRLCFAGAPRDPVFVAAAEAALNQAALAALVAAAPAGAAAGPR